MAPYYKSLMTYGPAVTAVPDWKLRLKKAWSVRFVGLFGIVQGLDAVWPNLNGSMDPVVYNLLAFALAALAFLSIFVKQEGFHYAPARGVNSDGK
jgi:hypothetical protein